MKITEVRITIPQNRDNNLLAYASITIDGCFAVHGLKIIDGQRGTFVAMPSKPIRDAKPGPDGRTHKFQDIVHPLSHECRTQIDRAVLDAYEDQLNK